MSDGSQGKAQGSANYIKILPNGDKLSVHAPNGIITGASLNGKPINNYEAAMHDLRGGTMKKNNGSQWYKLSRGYNFSFFYFFFISTDFIN